MGKIHGIRKSYEENMGSKYSLDKILLTIANQKWTNLDYFQPVGCLVSEYDMEEFCIELCYVYFSSKLKQCLSSG